MSRYLPRRPRHREAIQAWFVFLRNHRDAVAAMDFFTAQTTTSLGVWFIVDAGRRIVRFLIIANQAAAWLIHQVRDTNFRVAAQCNGIIDCTSMFSAAVVPTVNTFSARSAKATWRSQNRVAERAIGSLRRKLLDQVVVLGRPPPASAGGIQCVPPHLSHVDRAVRPPGRQATPRLHDRTPGSLRDATSPPNRLTSFALDSDRGTAQRRLGVLVNPSIARAGQADGLSRRTASRRCAPRARVTFGL